MLSNLPTFLGRSVLKSIDGKLWLVTLLSLPILKPRVHHYCQQSLADITSCRQMPRKPRLQMPIFTGFVGKSYFAKAMPTMLRNWPRTFCKGTVLPNKTTTNVNHISREQLSKEVFISLDSFKATVRGLIFQTQKIHLNKVSNNEFYGQW